MDAQPVTLVEALEISLRSPRSRNCLFARVRDGLEEEEQEALSRALDKVSSDTNNGQRKVYSSAWLAGVLTTQGYPISAATIPRHLRQVCGCCTGGSANE